MNDRQRGEPTRQLRRTREISRNFCSVQAFSKKKWQRHTKASKKEPKTPPIKPLLLFISYDSLKHSRILRALSELIAETTVTADECEAMLGKAWRRSVFQAQKETIKKEKIEDSELASLIDKMINFESFVGEEYLTTLHLKTIQLIVPDPE